MSWTRKLEEVRGSAFARAVVVLAGGTAAAQAISVGTLPIVTRLYMPEDFRVLALFVAVVQIASVAACLRLEIAIPLPESDEDAAPVLALSLLCAVATSVFVALVLAVAGAVGGIPQFAPLGAMQILIPIAVLLVGIYAALQFWSIRQRRFKQIAKTKFVQSFSSSAVQIALGLYKAGPIGLVCGSILQNGAGGGGLGLEAWRKDRALLRSVNWRSLRNAFAAYSRFPKYSVVESVAQTASLQLPIVIIASLPIGPEAGFLVLATKALQIPLTLISSAIAQVFAAEAPKALREGRLDELAARTIGGLVKVAAGPMLFIGIIAPVVFPFVFGSQWLKAGSLVLWLSPLFIMHMCAAAIGTTLYVHERQGVAMATQLAGLVIRVGAVLAVSATAVNWVSQAYAISGLVFYAGYLLVDLRVAGCTSALFWRSVKPGLPVVAAWVALGLAFAWLFRTVTG